MTGAGRRDNLFWPFDYGQLNRKVDEKVIFNTYFGVLLDVCENIELSQDKLQHYYPYRPNISLISLIVSV